MSKEKAAQKNESSFRTLKEREKEFIKIHSLKEEEYKKSKINIDEINKVKEEYGLERRSLVDIGNPILEILRSVPGVHSSRMRIKSTESLIKKLLKKQIEDPALEITVENYNNYITDKIGTRVLHLYKNDWLCIDDFIRKTWDTLEPPFAYARKGDPIKLYEEKKIEIKEHPMSYRSVHYLIKTKPTKIEYPVEIQVRTLFEEAWSEIDHQIRYPDNLGNTLINEYLRIFNRLSGSADEMGSFILLLKDHFKNYDRAKRENEITHQQKIKQLIDELKISKQEKEDLEKKIQNLSTFNNELSDTPFTIFPEVKSVNFSINDDNILSSPSLTAMETNRCITCGKTIPYSLTYKGLICDECRNNNLYGNNILDINNSW
ncbi:MAG: hypothetical protein ISS77_05665 [Phycisphaerae bacterium]|nr:hypothetical protein [Phycisphaerae bacterium]